jgi:altronate dehydratase
LFPKLTKRQILRNKNCAKHTYEKITNNALKPNVTGVTVLGLEECRISFFKTDSHNGDI